MRPILVVAKEQDYVCWYCEHEMIRHQHLPGQPTPRDAMTQDHITPRVIGGRTTVDNLVAACCQCNFMRGETDDTAFRNTLQKWFRRNHSLWLRWHSIPWEEVCDRKRQLALLHERVLRGKAVRHPDYAYRHQDYSWRVRQILERA